MKHSTDVTVVGLGYVGLPLVLAFANELPTTGFDVDVSRIAELSAGSDRNREIPDEMLESSAAILTTDPTCITDASLIVVTVPTPVTEDNQPDLSLLDSASALIGRQLRDRDSNLPAPIVVYESTTYPGCTEGFCGPIIERESGLKYGEGFFLGYSPERTNFGDEEHTLQTVIKVVSGSTPEVAEVVGDTYGVIAKAGIHMAPDIRTAEASKVIENVQRDLNIALFNELAMIFDRMEINSSDVFEAAGTKWNFHRYKPGLVGGHCIPVDPYYLTHAAANVGYEAKVILAGRDVSERMVEFIADKVQLLVTANGQELDQVDVLVLGQTFKSDVADIRNSKSAVLGKMLSDRFEKVDIFDPVESTFTNISDPFENDKSYDVVVLAVSHAQFSSSSRSIVDLVGDAGIFIDLTSTVNRRGFHESDVRLWSL